MEEGRAHAEGYPCGITLSARKSLRLSSRAIKPICRSINRIDGLLELDFQSGPRQRGRRPRSPQGTGHSGVQRAERRLTRTSEALGALRSTVFVGVGLVQRSVEDAHDRHELRVEPPAAADQKNPPLAELEVDRDLDPDLRSPASGGAQSENMERRGDEPPGRDLLHGLSLKHQGG